MSLPVDHLPLARWDGVHLVLHLGVLEHHLRRALERPGHLEDLRLAGTGDLLRVEALVSWRGARASVAVEVSEIRLRNRHLGLRVRRVVASSAVRIPRRAVLAALRRRFPGLVTTFPGEGIAVFNLEGWLPAELSLRVMTVQVTDRFLHLWVAAGSLHDVPVPGRRALPADTGDPTTAGDS